MTRRTLAIWSVSILALGIALLGASHFLLSPVTGDVLVLLSARQPDSIASTEVELHSSQGWTTIGSIPTGAVAKAPETTKGVLTRVPVGTYDGIRLLGVAASIGFEVAKDGVNTLLVGVDRGRPMPNAVYAGSQAVSVGLNELSGQMMHMPAFRLVDQFGRPFTNADIEGHDVLLATFHTTCRETCPLVTGLFLQLRQRLPPSVLLVEVTISPGEDTSDVMREYAGRIGASWTFATGTPEQLAAFWKPFGVSLTNGDVHRSTLAVIDSHGYVRSYFLGAPDVAETLPAELQSQLNNQGRRLLLEHGNGWGEAQIIDVLNAVGGLASRSGSVEGRAPEFALQSLDGRTVNLRDYLGRPVVINFWATYCAPCRRELPLIEKVAAQYPRLAVVLIDERDSSRAASNLVAQLGLRSPVLVDAEGSAGDAFGITGLPTTYFVRADGTIEGRYIGETDAGILARHLDAIQR